MRCVYVESFTTSPLEGLKIGDLEPRLPGASHPSDPDPEGWVEVDVRAASLNHHDLWSLRGVGLAAASLPMVLGTDAAGVTDDGREVIVHSVISSPTWSGEETSDPSRTLLSEKYPGALAETVRVPARNLVEKPPGLTFAEAACLPTAFLTAYNLLFASARATPGQRILIQGATGGVASAATLLARAAGAHVIVSTRGAQKAEFARALGAHEVVASGERVAPVDAVIETVGEATWEHSLRALKPGGAIAVAGATSGPNPSADLARVFFRNLKIIGTTMGSRTQLEHLVGFLLASGVRPHIYREYDFGDDDAVRRAFSEFHSGAVWGKAVLVR